MTHSFSGLFAASLLAAIRTPARHTAGPHVAQWHYHLLPQALGCDAWFAARVTTCGELDAAMSKAESCRTGVYIEVVTDKYVAPPMAMKLHESTKELYKN